jgi:ectoine hydroxylase-related dioxygenase (phytanoyl-CoA dioxygenase family)
MAILPQRRIPISRRNDVDLVDQPRANVEEAAVYRAIAESGFAAVEGAIDATEIRRLVAATSHAQGNGLLKRGGNSYAIRDLFNLVPAVRELARCSAIRSYIEPVLGPTAFAVRGILFDKVASANWLVPWHQDLTIEVSERVDSPGFGPWSVKAGVPHVQPPISILQQMLAVRIHLDDCHAESGPLRVIPGSHRHGRLTIEEMLDRKALHGEVALTARRGDIILMRPLLVHASSPASRPEHRRVIHLEYCNEGLPGELQWRCRV